MIKLAAAALAVAAALPLAAAAQNVPPTHLDFAYDAQLAALQLSADDAKICNKYTGQQLTQCKVTRNFLAQINKGVEKKGSYPPNAQGQFVQTNDELDKLGQRLPPEGG